jgi:hypothetical protein
MDHHCHHCDRQGNETSSEHFSWIKYAHPRHGGDRYLAVCRHMTWPEFCNLAVKWPPRWKVNRVARRASPRHYLNVISIYDKLQQSPPALGAPGTMTIKVTGVAADKLLQYLRQLQAKGLTFEG